MKSAKLAKLEEAIQLFLEQDEVADGEDGYFGNELSTHMATAAAAVYDSHMEKEQFLEDERIMVRA